MYKSLLSFLLVLTLATGAEREGESERPNGGRVYNAPPVAAWGIDACLSVHVDPVSLPEWVALLRQSDVRWLRERGVWGDKNFDEGIRERLGTLRAAGFNIVAFAGTPSSVTAQRAGNQLPEDLLAVYASGLRQGREYAGLVSAWEMTGEPDVGYCRDLPDRLAAYNKAMYLGLKSGAAAAFQPSLSEKFKDGSQVGALDLNLKLSPSTNDGRLPIVLMGALALPPGPWWERAVDNGLLDYTDAYNFHFYGNAEDLTSVIGAHCEALRGVARGELSSVEGRGGKARGRPADRSGFTASRVEEARVEGWGRARRSALDPRPLLPFWLTECGVNATLPGDFLNEERREFQAEFTRSTARQALAARDVAMFMPFILVHRDDPHAMTLPVPPAPLPAWYSYAKLTKEQAWPERVLSVPAGDRANPVMVQWMPAEGTASHKVAGTYRVGPNEVLSGELRVYNFGERAVEGELSARADSLSREVKFKARGVGVPDRRAGLQFFTETGRAERVTLSIPAGGCVTVPVIYTPESDTRYFRDWIKAAFRETSGRVSPVAFGVEREPVAADFVSEPVPVYPLRGDSRVKPPVVNVEGAQSGPWRVFNGLTARSAVAPVAVWRDNGDGTREARSAVGPASLQSRMAQSAFTRFEVTKPVNDPLAPTYALGALRGVPEGTRFLRLRLDRPMTRNATVRVDLVDADGERFSIWENLGNAYGKSSREVWLGLEDFHPYFWSKAVAGNRRLRPDKVREISLRFYLMESGSMDVELEWMSAR